MPRRSRAATHVVRYGGEEFVAILADATARRPWIAERIRAAVRELRIHSEGVGLNRP
jgi:PleD family two-component response regulator